MPLILPPPETPDFPVLRFGEPAPLRLKGGAVAIGNFDGVHRGHRVVLDAARAAAGSGPALALSFEPHPRAFFQPEAAPFRLSPEPIKARLLAGVGMDGLAVARFDAAFAALSAEEFIARALVDWLGARHVVAGFNFRFGAGRAGGPETLAEAGRRLGFCCTRVEAVAEAGATLSSGAVRAALAAGDVPAANALLGRAFFVCGEVVHGRKLGRTLGYPTANLRLAPDFALPYGVYAVKLGLRGEWRDGVASYGRRPTVDDGPPLLEVHVFDFSGDLYGRQVDVAFAAFLRPELKFDGLPALIRQMDEDSREARAVLAA